MTKELNPSNLQVTAAKDRRDILVSSLLYSRATMFYPALRETKAMKETRMAVMNAGGTAPDRPLASTKVNLFGVDYNIGLHSEFLLHPHREILENLLSYAQTIQLDDKAIQENRPFLWSEVLSTVKNYTPLHKNSIPLSNNIDPYATVLSMSMYDLALAIGLTPHKTNYETIEERITQLASAWMLADRLDDDGNVVDRAPIRFILDFRLVHDPSQSVNDKSTGSTPNHVFIVPHSDLLKAISGAGYIYRREQILFSQYSQPLLRSFIKFLKTHTGSFLQGKKLDWLLQFYIESFSVEPSNKSRLKIELRKLVIDNSEALEKDWGILFTKDDSAKTNAYKANITSKFTRYDIIGNATEGDDK